MVLIFFAEDWLTREIHSGLDLGRPVAQALEEEFLTVAVTYLLHHNFSHQLN